MKIIKIELHYKMSDAWLNNSMICYIERKMFDKIDLEKIEKSFYLSYMFLLI